MVNNVEHSKTNQVEETMEQNREQAVEVDKKDSTVHPLIKETARFNGIDKDLKSALNTWSELSEKLTGKVSPDEEQLKEIKKLLGDLKSKLQDFT